MNRHRESIRAALEATVIHSATSFSWFGERTDELPSSVRQALTLETARSYLHYSLQSRLYTDFYCAGGAQTWTRRQGNQVPTGRTPFVEALSEANSGQGYSSPGWTVTGSSRGMVTVRKGGVRLYAGPSDYECSDPETVPQFGSTLCVRFPKEFIHLSPGFYMAVGNRELAPGDGEAVVRWYWNLTASGAISFLREITRDLNRMLVPFKLKVLNDPACFVRCDAVVLYVRERDYNEVSEALARVHLEVASSLKPSTPALTKEVAVGVGIAEDPGGITSFGLHRCGLLAEGMIQAHEAGRHVLSERLEVINESFVAEGLSIDRPYLNPGSSDRYRLIARAAPVATRGSKSSVSTADRGHCLETALAIGLRLTEEAMWHRDRCTWLGPEAGPEAASQVVTRTTYRTLGPDLYAGSSGLALFLAQLHVATDHPAARKAALGAIAQAYSTLQAVPPAVRFGLYAGWSGIALAAVRVGTLLDTPEWIEKALALLGQLAREDPRQAEPDLLAGVAGGVVALLVLWEALDEAALLEMALRQGDVLLAAAEPADAGRSWTSVSHPENPGLTGFSHGASGIGYALFELFAATGDARYLDVAQAAFDYERLWYDPDAANWPDLRGRLHQKPETGSSPPFQTAWCHGAPGIALARLRAYARFCDERHRDEALTALDTTACAVEAGLSSQNHNYSLCHGMAGNADILLCGHRILDEDRPDDIGLVHRVAGLGIQLYSRAGNVWPCGIPEETPGLMLGLAGIGYFYLRVADSSVPSTLEPLPPCRASWDISKSLRSQRETRGPSG
ncbi:MAG: lanthionine synthetase LanC family protein [Kiloniellales bacterium]|nr:lanthionine synthetase LanC family protein [Kiloniellales bacterium]